MLVYIDTKKHMHGLKYILPQTDYVVPQMDYVVGLANWRWVDCVVQWVFQADWRKESSVEEVGGSVETWRTELAVEAVEAAGRFVVPSMNDQGDKPA